MGQDSLYVPIYGNQDWFIAKGFETSTELSNKITFSSDYFIEYESDEFQLFNKMFVKMTLQPKSLSSDLSNINLCSLLSCL